MRDRGLFDYFEIGFKELRLPVRYKIVSGERKASSRVVEKLGTVEEIQKRIGDQDPYLWADEYARRKRTHAERKGKIPGRCREVFARQENRLGQKEPL